MRPARLSIGFFCLVLGMVGPAGAEPPATPAPKPESAPQHATAPSLPGQPNREGTVKPDGGLPMDSEGYAITKTYDPSAPAQKPAAGAAPASGAAPAGQAAPAPVPSVPIGPAPTGKGVVTGTNTITVRGSLVSLESGKSVTIKLQKTGKQNTYTLAPGATVGKDLAPGQLVRVRVLADQKGKVADRVEVVPPPTPAAAKKEGGL